jgi:probable DNA repair protein
MEFAAAAIGETAVNFHQRHGPELTTGALPLCKTALPIVIMQWCMPLRRQHAGRLACCWAEAIRGCIGSSSVNTSRKDAAQRLMLEEYHSRAGFNPHRIRYNGGMSSLHPRTHFSTESWTEQALLQTLAAGSADAVILTSTERAARTLRQRYHHMQQAGGHAGWQTPPILAWSTWLNALWEAALLQGKIHHLLLTEFQELEQWRTVLSRDKTAQQTLSSDALAALAQKSFQQMQQYRIPLQRLRGDNTLDTASFFQWATQFQKLCRDNSYLSASQLEEALTKYISEEEISLPQKIFLVGFDRVPPTQSLLLDALRQRDCRVEVVELVPAQSVEIKKEIRCASTAEQEIKAVALWARDRLMQQPNQQIGIVVPTLDTVRAPMESIFRRILAPSSMDVRSPSEDLPYEFSLGTPMRKLPLIRTALTILHWLYRPMPAEDISWLLVQGAFSRASLEDRATLDRKFRERNYQLGNAISFPMFQQWMTHFGNPPGASGLRQTIENIRRTAKKIRIGQALTFAEWREGFEELLDAAEWQLLLAATSADFQLLRRWNALLSSFSGLNSVAGRVPISIALDRLEHLASHMLFSLETRNAPVQILGVPESSGIVFDAVWWMNAQGSAWPPQNNAQPFLPWTLQREARMPYADPVEDAAFATRTAQRILRSANTVVASFFLEESDDENTGTHTPNPELVLSPFVRAAWPDVPIVASSPAMSEAQRPNTFLETVTEEPAVPFQGAEVRGGVKFLQLQAACPFRAFAELRLGTRPLEDPGLGVSNRDQGTLMHRVLEKFWRDVASHANLMALSAEEIHKRVREHIEGEIKKFFPSAEEPWQRTLLQLESDRLEQRLLEWLEQEKKRSSFTVLQTETKLKPTLNGITFQCRIDRMDRVDDGIALIDYKTGDIKPGSCEGDRPDEPQLPAYAVLRQQSPLAAEPLAGVAFGSLHTQDVRFKVVASLPEVFAPSLRSKRAGLSAEAMANVEQEWTATLAHLAEGFRAGAAIVDPKKKTTCDYCEQTLLCRIRETALAATEMDALVEEDETGEAEA